MEGIQYRESEGVLLRSTKGLIEALVGDEWKRYVGIETDWYTNSKETKEGNDEETEEKEEVVTTDSKYQVKKSPFKDRVKGLIDQQQKAYQGNGQRVRFTRGEFAGKEGTIQSQIKKEFRKEPDTYRVLVDGFPIRGGWDGIAIATGDMIEKA